jgi:hypothetical protein
MLEESLFRANFALIFRLFRAGFALDFRILVAEFSLSRIAARGLVFLLWLESLCRHNNSEINFSVLSVSSLVFVVFGPGTGFAAKQNPP